MSGCKAATFEILLLNPPSYSRMHVLFNYWCREVVDFLPFDVIVKPSMVESYSRMNVLFNHWCKSLVICPYMMKLSIHQWWNGATFVCACIWLSYVIHHVSLCHPMGLDPRVLGRTNMAMDTNANTAVSKKLGHRQQFFLLLCVQ